MRISVLNKQTFKQTLRFDEEIHKKLKFYCKSRRTSMQKVIMEWLKEEMKKKTYRDAYKEDESNFKARGAIYFDTEQEKEDFRVYCERKHAKFSELVHFILVKKLT